MTQEDNDEPTRIALWISFGVLALVVLGVIGGMVMRQLRGLSAQAAAPVAVTQTVVTEEIVLIEGPLAGDLMGTLYFESAQSALPANAGDELAKVQQALAAAPSRKVVLSGFHDATGDPAINAELAKQRAMSARAALMSSGIDASRIALRKPEVTVGSGTGQEARRVEMRLVD